MRARRMMSAARAVLGAALDLVYPPRCYACDRDLARGRLCEGCRHGLVPILNPCPRCASPRGPGVSGKRCDQCRSTSPGFRGAVAAVEYEGPASTLVQRLKYAGERDQAYLLGEMTAGAVLDAPFRSEIQAIVPVPLDRVRRRERGFNQARLLVRAILPAFRKATADESLKRIRPTRVQSRLTDPKERQANVAGAFAVESGEHLQGKTVLLVDDVVTTAVTVSECATVLREAGAAAVDVLAVALAVGSDEPEPDRRKRVRRSKRKMTAKGRK